MELTRTGLMTLVGAGAGAAALGPLLRPDSSFAAKKKSMPPTEEYTLPDLPYPADALEPHLDERTLRLHHDKHHAGYVKGLNSTLEKIQEAHSAKDFSNIASLCGDLAFHASGHVLHTLYFAGLSPKPGKPRGAFAKAVKAQFGGLEKMQAALVAASNAISGSGWGLLAYEPTGGRLLVLGLEKHENRMAVGALPLMPVDVWEHAYYLKYRNKRGEYTKAVMNVIDWKEVSERFGEIVG